MKCTTKTKIMRTVRVQVPRDKVAEWLRSLGCHIPEEKVSTIDIHFGYRGFQEVEITWELDDRQSEEEVEDVRNIPPLTLPDPV